MATMFGRGMRVLGTLVLATGATLAVSAPAHAADPGAMIRGAHFSPTTPGVDVYLSSFSGGSSRLWLPSVTYGAVSPYQRITPGLYTVAMRAAGASANTKPVLSWTLNARSGKAYTVAGIGAGASVRGIVIGDDLSSPPAGQGRVRVIQAASRAPVVTVTAKNGPVIARAAAFATTTAYANVPAGRWTLSAVSGDRTAPVSTSAAVSVVSGVNTSVLLLDAKSSGITLRTVQDSSSAATAPVGSVPAGGGGTAGLPRASTGSTNGWSGLAGVGALTMVTALAGASWSRRRRSTSGGGRHAIG